MEEGFARITLLVAEDDDEDYLYFEKALELKGPTQPKFSCMRFKNGKDLLDFLQSRGESGAEGSSRFIILLDLRMPGMDGHEFLRAVKSCPRLAVIPVVICSSSADERDIRVSYELGATSYLRKTPDLGKFESNLRAFVHYWLQTATLPSV